MIRQAKEGELAWLPGLHLSDIPSPLPNGIAVHLRGAEIGLEAQGLVGAIPLLNGYTLQIGPKIGRVNFFRLLFKAEGFQPELEREYDAFVSYSVEEIENIDSIVARQLLFSAAEIMKRSPQQGRVRRRRRGMFAAGQIDVVSTALNLACRTEDPVTYFIRERTLDIPENRVLTEAITRAWRTLDETDRVQLRSVQERWRNRFPASADLDADLEHVERGFASGRYGGPRDYYRRALMLAQIVLGSNGLGLSSGETVEGDAILLNTADIFEKYLRSVISDAYSDSGYVVSKGGVGVTSLYTDGSFELQPDITISKDGRTLLIADAKYKQPTAGDHYQMHTYLAVNHIKRGLLLAPLYEGDEVVLREYSTTDKTVVREVYLPMNNLPLTEDFLRTVLQLAA
jgi:5-methylcytosine-specific restriction endonuclease McrBC regulatory subunit McrC